MATDRVIMAKIVSPIFLGCFYPILFILAGNDDMHESSARTSLKFGQIRLLTVELAALERKKKSPETYNGKNGVATFSRLFLIGSISYLQVTMTYHTFHTCR